MSKSFHNLFILEMANNHMGELAHGIKIINEAKQVVDTLSNDYGLKFAIKFQYRDLDSFIHPDYKSRTDIKYIKRFLETRLNEDDFLQLKEHAESSGFISICTPFDEISVSAIENHKYSILKIASCSFTDWPLLERIAKTNLPIIASSAGATLDDIDQVVAFMEHRKKDFCLMHCVGSYPTPPENMELNQIGFFKKRYKDLPVGFSTHEDPNDTDSIKMAIAQGARTFERHIGLKTEKYQINAYSSSPQQLKQWLESAIKAFTLCGVENKRRTISKKENYDLRGLQRGVFAMEGIPKKHRITPEDYFLAIPNVDNQLVANDLSKYIVITTSDRVKPNAPIISDDVSINNKRQNVLKIVNDISRLIKKSNIKLANKIDMELSHHYGLEHFYEYGCTIFNCINREYCKKIIIVLPGQKHPSHWHKTKEETFHILHGNLSLALNGKTKTYNEGDLAVIERETKHSFCSEEGAIFEEVSTTHIKSDSFYEDESICSNKYRKTEMTFWADWLEHQT